MASNRPLAGHSGWTLGKSRSTSLGWYFVHRLAVAFFGGQA